MQDFSEKKYLRHQQPGSKRSLAGTIVLAAGGIALMGGLAAFLCKSNGSSSIEQLRKLPVAEHVMRDFRKYGTSETVDGMCVAEGLYDKLPACQNLVMELNPKMNSRQFDRRAPREGETILGPDANGDGHFGRTEYK